MTSNIIYYRIVKHNRLTGDKEFVAISSDKDLADKYLERNNDWYIIEETSVFDITELAK